LDFFSLSRSSRLLSHRCFFSRRSLIAPPVLSFPPFTSFDGELKEEGRCNITDDLFPFISASLMFAGAFLGVSPASSFFFFLLLRIYMCLSAVPGFITWEVPLVLRLRCSPSQIPPLPTNKDTSRDMSLQYRVGDYYLCFFFSFYLPLFPFENAPGQHVVSGENSSPFAPPWKDAHPSSLIAPLRPFFIHLK